MPVPLRIGERKFFYKYSFPLQVFYHFFYRDIVITDCWCFAVTLYTKVIQLYNKRRLMCFGSLGNGEWMMEWKVVCFVREFHALLAPDP